MRDKIQNLIVAGCIVLAVLSMSGCTARLHLYPVAGPVASQAPPPVFPAKISVNFATRSGSFSTALQNGETFHGEWKLNTPGPANPASPDDLSATWDQVYGVGYYTAKVLGDAQCGSATVTGSKGTTLHMQICGAEKAVAKDSNGNVYKLTADRMG